jgi:hypothetical protein
MFIRLLLHFGIYGVTLATRADTHVGLPVNCHLLNPFLIKIWIIWQTLLKSPISNLINLFSDYRFSTWRIDMTQIRGPFCNIFLQTRQKICYVPHWEIRICRWRRCNGIETTILISRLSLSAVAMSLFPSLAYFMIYFKRIITYLMFCVWRMTSSLSFDNCHIIERRPLWLTITVCTEKHSSLFARIFHV